MCVNDQKSIGPTSVLKKTLIVKYLLHTDISYHDYTSFVLSIADELYIHGLHQDSVEGLLCIHQVSLTKMVPTTCFLWICACWNMHLSPLRLLKQTPDVWSSTFCFGMGLLHCGISQIICSDACMLGDWISSWGFQPKTQLPALCCILGFCLLMLADGTGCKFQPLAPANLPLDMRGAAKTSLFKPRKSLPVQLTQLPIDFAWFHCVPHINHSSFSLSSPK